MDVFETEDGLFFKNTNRRVTFNEITEIQCYEYWSPERVNIYVKTDEFGEEKFTFAPPISYKLKQPIPDSNIDDRPQCIIDLIEKMELAKQNT
ncbi:MAG: hypothetical protein HRT89_15145 [Lentisphaeria bacterium]|nr:hypothetical protein [Lentisphaeria bacterium]NQZ69392.1 hypothetical protein [Lentisphaeria bacterium]